MSLEDEKLGQELSAYLDGELDQRDARRVEDALARDPALQAELESLRSLRQMLRRLPVASAPAGLDQRVIRRTERATLLDDKPGDVERSSGGWFGRLAAAAVILIAVGVGAVLISNIGQTGGVGEGEVALTDDDRVLRPPVLTKGGPEALAGRKLRGKDYGTDGYLTPPAQPDPLPVVNYFVNTDNLELAQHDVQRVLVRNGLQDVAMVNDKEFVSPKAVVGRRGPFFDQAAAGPNRIEIDVVIGEGQLQKIITELNEIRSNQKVAQVPLREMEGLAELADAELAMAEAARKDEGRDEKAAGFDDRGRGAGKGAAGDVPSKPRFKTKGPAPSPAAMPARPGGGARDDVAQAEQVGPAARRPVPARSQPGKIAPAEATDTAVAAAKVGPTTRPAAKGLIVVADPPGVTPTVAADQQQVMTAALNGQVTSMPTGDVLTMPAMQQRAQQFRGGYVYAKIRQLRIVLNAVDVEPKASSK